jgi:hypothetical protein
MLINQYGYHILKIFGLVDATSLYFCCLIYCDTNSHHLSGKELGIKVKVRNTESCFSELKKCR